MARSAFPNGTVPDVTKRRRVVVAHASELDTTQDAVAGKAPETLTLVKRYVQQMDVLETASPATWTSHIAALSRDDYKNMFRYRAADRLRKRYQVYGFQRTTLEALRLEFSALLDFNPALLAAGWFENSATAGTVQTWTSSLGGFNAPTQGTASARPTADAQRALIFATNDNYQITLDGLWGTVTSRLAFAFWWDPDGVAALETLAVAHTTAGSSVNKFELRHNSGRLEWRIFVNDTDGRIYRTPISSVVAAPQFVYVAWDSTQATEAARPMIVLNGASQTLTQGNLGAGAEPTTLRSATGTAQIGMMGATQPVNGRLGPDFWTFHQPLSLAQISQYAGYRPIS